MTRTLGTLCGRVPQVKLFAMGGKDYTDEFISKTLDHTLWIEKAEHLLEVASFIEPRIGEMWSQVRSGESIKQHYITTYFMLVAYALENLLKPLYTQLSKALVYASFLGHGSRSSGIRPN